MLPAASVTVTPMLWLPSASGSVVKLQVPLASAVVVPVFVEWLGSHGREAAWDVGRSVLSLTVVVLGSLMVFTIVAAPWIVKLYTVNVRPRNLATVCDRRIGQRHLQRIGLGTPDVRGAVLRAIRSLVAEGLVVKTETGVYGPA